MSNYDVQRWTPIDEYSIVVQHHGGRFVLAAEAEAHERAALDACKATHAVLGMEEVTRIAAGGYEQAIRACIDAVIAAGYNPDGPGVAALRALLTERSEK